MKKYLSLMLIVAFATSACENSSNQASSQTSKPNVIYLLADDLGYGDLSSFGQKHFQTPNIDRLAAEGMRFLQHYSGSTVCAPSRSALMTGMHTGHTFIRGNKEVKPEGQYPMSAESYTLAEMLKEQGYTTGAFGKWGLGFPGSEGDPNKQGFDQFYGINCQRLAHNYYPDHHWNNQEKVMLTGNDNGGTEVFSSVDIHSKALDFIETNKDRPFFMFYPTAIPHAELFAPEEYMEKYRGKFLPEHAYKGVDDGDNFRKGPYGSQPESHAAFAAMVNLLDDQVGEIIDKVKELGLEENTLIIFTSDNGPHKEGGADPDYFDSNGIFKGYKRDLYEGGIRVPMIAKWKGKIQPGSQTEHASAFWDMMPTLADLLEIAPPDNMDGVSFLPTLLGKPGQKEHDYLYWEFHERGGRIALRKGDWKLVRYNVNKDPQGDFELYHIPNDPGEENNLAASNPEKLAELQELLKNARTESEIFAFRSETYNAEKK